ncbi:MucBP domain-containing protein [Fusibacter bizertensis]
MKKSIKRVLSMLLVAVLVLGSIPMMSYAETQPTYKYGGDQAYGKDVEFNDSGTEYDTILFKVNTNTNHPAFFSLAYCLDTSSTIHSSKAYNLFDLNSVPYLSSANANKIRAIVLNGYPNQTIQTLRQRANNNDLNEKEALTATQAAIWKYSNNRNMDWAHTPDDDNDGYYWRDMKTLYDYLDGLSGVSAVSPAAINTQAPTASIDGNDVLIQFNYKNVGPNPTVTLSLPGFTKTVAAGSNGYTTVSFRKALSSFSASNFTTYSISITGQNPVTDVFSFFPVDGQDKTQTLVSLPLTQMKSVSASVNGNLATLLASVTVNKSFTDQAKTEVAFELKAGNTVIESGTTSNQTITWNNLIPGNYTLFETTPSRYISSIAGGHAITLTASEHEVVNVTNTPEPKTTITVHHISETGATLAADDQLMGYADETYTASAKSIAHYTVKTAPVNETGLFGSTNMELTYVYKEDPKSTVTAIYVDESDVTIAPSVATTDYVGQPYTTSAKSINHYELVSEPTNATGTYAEESTTVKYVYKENAKTTITVYHQNESGTNLVSPETLTGYADESYSTSAQSIAHYELITTPDNASGTYGTEDFTLTYVYKENAKTTITVYHQNESGTNLVSPETLTGYADESYSTSAQSIAHYELITTPDNASGTYGTEDFTLTYVYKENAKTTITVKYVDGNGTEIATSDSLSGYADESYSTSAKSIANYSLSETPANASGTYGTSDFEVVYVYTASDKLTITVKYVNTNQVEIASPDFIQGYPGDSYTSSPKSITDYQLITNPENANGVFGEENFEIIYVYESLVSPTDPTNPTEPTNPTQPTEPTNPTQAPTEPTTQAPTEPQGPQGSVVVNFVDTDGISIASSFNFTGSVGTLYQTSARTIDGYELVETPANASGSFIDGSITVDYVYSNGVTVAEEETPLGEAITPINFDSIYDNMETTEAASDEAVILDEETPLADALPQTGQASPELFYGIGSIVSALGIYLKRKNK